MVAFFGVTGEEEAGPRRSAGTVTEVDERKRRPASKLEEFAVALPLRVREAEVTRLVFNDLSLSVSATLGLHSSSSLLGTATREFVATPSLDVSFLSDGRCSERAVTGCSVLTGRSWRMSGVIGFSSSSSSLLGTRTLDPPVALLSDPLLWISCCCSERST